MSAIYTKTSSDYGTDKVQGELIILLKRLDEFCRDNSILYSVNGGTLLGAIRNGDFIPWDDDADVMFDRPEYEKFMKCADSSLPDDLEIIGDTWIKRITFKDNPEKDLEIGCIDLFVMDNIPDSKALASIKHAFLKMLQGMLKRKVDLSDYSTVNKILISVTHEIGKLFSTKTKQNMYSRVSQWGNAKMTKKRNIYNSLFKQISTFKYESNIMDGYSDFQFAGTIVMGITHYDNYLSVAYGDNYLTPPPESERAPIHLTVK